jgi:glycosyltransferase involved in cell wall biosynthesis
MKVLAIIPAYNEEESIGELLFKFLEYGNIDVLVINDCSEDDTSRICKENGVNVIDLPCNLGIGGAVQTGYRYAKKAGYDIAVQVDGDGQHNPQYITQLIEPLIKEEADLIIGSRYLEKHGFQSTILRRVGIRYFSYLIKVLKGRNVTDPTSGFRACNKSVINLFAERYPIDYPEPESIVFLLRNNFIVKEVPVIMNERISGESSIKDLKTVYYMIKVSLAIIIDTLRKQVV